ncbi:excinuclease ABC subunit UvrB [Candidatus Uhrbacteria bacterium]|nr:excinuclease ABC subunit UvrB [Candidatus Uhrbacteria bacterium]
MKFKLVSQFKPAGDQPKAIRSLTDGFHRFDRQTLLGITGSGKTYTLSCVIEQLQIPTIVIAHNKTLAAQLYTEFRNFFPKNKVCYFVSYYDYYLPESYLPQTDTYIEKETQINERIEQLRMEAAASLVSRPDVIVIASVSCIYGLGSPHDFMESKITISQADRIGRHAFLSKLVDALYERNDTELRAGRFRVRGDTVDVMQGFGGDIYRFEFFDDEVESIALLDPISLDETSKTQIAHIYPAKPFVAPEEKRKSAISSIREELRTRLPQLGMLEAHRLEQRTQYDLEMIEQLGYCKGIENYSRHFDGRPMGKPPFCLLDFFRSNPFSKEFLICIDESHATIPQIQGMHRGDYARKRNLVDYGFRLPSAYDNRPLTFPEFESYLDHTIFVSATPDSYETQSSGQVVEQVVRPTGLLDPTVTVRPIKGYIADLCSEIAVTVRKGSRVLVTTLTKRSAEELSEYLTEHDVKARYLHSEIDTIDRAALIKDLRLGVYDVLVGINLLREGLDIPEVELVAILDADKEGFLRNATSLIQTIGRASRHADGRVVMYADTMTGSLKKAIEETERRRAIQIQYNKEYGITPASIKKKVETSFLPGEIVESVKSDARKNLVALQEEMRAAVERLDFEKAILLRDAIRTIVEKRTRKSRT